MSAKIVILGGCGGIGRVLVADAVNEGYEVHVVDLHASIEAHPVDAPTLAADATSISDLERAANALPSDIVGFVNLVGFMDENCQVLDISPDRWEAILNGNLTANYNATKVFRAKMCQGASIVMTGSGLGHFARPGYGAYAISKAGVAALTRQLALELAPHIRVNCVAPSAVDTAFLRGGTGRSDENQEMRIDLNEYCKKIPLKRIAKPADTSGPILFLLSDSSRYMTGQVLHVNGGTYMP